jgi:glucose-1-phosphate cytidylyltransferase
MAGFGPVAILCGGRGTRLQERTHAIPKALVEIGGRPIVWHVIGIYAAHGMRRFLLLTGYLGQMIEEFVAATRWPEEVEVECCDTGRDTPTGGRVALVSDLLGDGPFCLTYADGVADIDLHALVAFHRGHGAIGTITVVRPRSQFGLAELSSDDRVLRFEEKPRLDHWVNGGFFCFQPGFLDYLEPASVLEGDPLRVLAGDGELRAFRHPSFWDCMDTYKDAVVLNDLWRAGEAPWPAWRAGTAESGAPVPTGLGDRGGGP